MRDNKACFACLYRELFIEDDSDDDFEEFGVGYFEEDDNHQAIKFNVNDNDRLRTEMFCFEDGLLHLPGRRYYRPPL